MSGKAGDLTSEKDVYKDEKTSLLYFRDINHNVYCLNMNSKVLSFCCKTRIKYLKDMTEHDKRPKREVYD